jgi:integrase
LTASSDSPAFHRNWHVLSILRAQNEHRRAAVLTVDEVRNLLAHIKTFHNHGYASTVFFCGLRLHEGSDLEVSDIDSQRTREPARYFVGKT